MIRSTFLIVFTLMVTFQVKGTDVKQLREMFYKASQSAASADTFYSLMKKTSSSDGALLEGYHAMAEFMKCYHSYNPYNKLAYYNKAKSRLDKAIQLEPGNIELRYLRFSVQTSVPAFLGYKENIENDKKMMLEKLSSLSNDVQLAGLISEFLLQSNYCNADEIESVKQASKGY